jgi:hypothetical protein
MTGTFTFITGVFHLSYRHERSFLVESAGETKQFSLISFDVLSNGCAGDSRPSLKRYIVTSAKPDRVSVAKKEKYPRVCSMQIPRRYALSNEKICLKNENTNRERATEDGGARR